MKKRPYFILLTAFYLLYLNYSLFAYDLKQPYDTVLIKMGDTYALKISVIDSVITSNIFCTPKRKNYLYTLYKISVEEVFVVQDSSVYRSVQEIFNLKYVIVDARDKFFIPGKEYFITASSSTDYSYLMVRKYFSQEVHFKYIRNFAHINGLVECVKPNLFQKIGLFLGFDRNKIYSKVKRRRNSDKDEFLKAIKGYKKN